MDKDIIYQKRNRKHSQTFTTNVHESDVVSSVNVDEMQKILLVEKLIYNPSKRHIYAARTIRYLHSLITANKLNGSIDTRLLVGRFLERGARKMEKEATIYFENIERRGELSYAILIIESFMANSIGEEEFLSSKEKEVISEFKKFEESHRGIELRKIKDRFYTIED